MNYLYLQAQYEKIYSFFRTTCEPFDFIEWDGKILYVWKDEDVIEKYLLKDVKNLIFKSNKK